MKRVVSKIKHGMLFILACLFSSLLLAGAEDEIIEEIVVVAEIVDELELLQPSDAASRLGLSLLETPATVEVIDGSTMQARGYKQVTDAVQSLPGVVSGESPAAPSTFSMRGFTRSQITILRDGLWVGPAVASAAGGVVSALVLVLQRSTPVAGAMALLSPLGVMRTWYM